MAATFAEIARFLTAAQDVTEVFGRIATLGAQLVPGADHCAVTVQRGSKVWTAGTSSSVPPSVDSLQYATDQGPCLEAIRSSSVYEVEDARTDPRWPAFLARAVAETPVRSFLSYRLHGRDRVLGALNLYGEQPRRFDGSSHEVAALLAAHAALAIDNIEELDGLRTALESRDLIATAKGILMAREGVTEQEAFDILRRASRRSNVRVRNLAEQIVQGSTDSPDPTPPPS